MPLLRFLYQFGQFLFKFKGKIPGSSVGIWIVITFFYNLINSGFGVAINELSLSIFGAELIIQKNVNLAIINSIDYGLYQFFEIIIAVMTLYLLVKFISKFIDSVAGAQSSFGSVMVSILIVAILEIGAIKLVGGQFDFIPFYDGVWFLIMNLKPVLINAVPSLFGLLDAQKENLLNTQNTTDIALNTTNSTVNVTLK